MDPGHLVNMDFKDFFHTGIETCRMVVCVCVEGAKAGFSIFTFSPVDAFSNLGKLADKQSSAGLSIWIEGEPVHLTEAA